ncbi:MAG: metallophosphoesterase family protein [bacterium]
MAYKSFMILGVMSDSHGNVAMMQKAADLMVKKFGVEAIVHLGDDYADAQKLDPRGRALYAVPGMYEAAWMDDNVSHRLIKDFGGVVFLISHTPTRDKHDKHGDMNPGRAMSKYGAQVLLHGHTHKFGVMKAIDGLIVINPGHLKSETDRGAMPTFAVIDVKEPDISVKFVDLEGEVLDSHELTVAKVPLTPPCEEPYKPGPDEESSIG